MEKRWQRGDTVIVRYPPEDRMTKVYLATGRDKVINVAGWPHVVLQDSENLVALYMPEGTELWRWDIAEDRARPVRISQGDSVRLFFPGKRYEVSLFYETGTGPAPWVQDYFPGVEGRFYGWKVDLTSPFVRTDVGFDMIDEVLDIVVTPDRRYEWRDEDWMARLVQLAIYTEAEVSALREAGREVIKLIEARASPFDEKWPKWRPDSGLILGAIPEGWQTLPVPAPYLAYTGPLV